MSLTISLTADEVEQRLHRLGVSCRFTPEERSRFLTTPVVNTGYAILGFPTPAENSTLTLSNLRNIVGVDPLHQPAFFDHPWYGGEEFMNAACVPGWHFISMDVIPGSAGQSIDYASHLSRAGLELPLAIEVVLMLFLHYAGTQEQLLFRKHTWCSDQASLDRHVTVGAFGRNGLFVSGHPARFASRGLGICAKVRTGT